MTVELTKAARLPEEKTFSFHVFGKADTLEKHKRDNIRRKSFLFQGQ